MDFITMPAICGIFVYGTYKLFELFARKKERLAMIEKLGSAPISGQAEYKINLSSSGSNTFSALKFGCLFTGIGLGLLIAFLISEGFGYNDAFVSQSRRWAADDVMGVIYGSCVLLFGGFGLLAAFLIELKIKKEQKD